MTPYVEDLDDNSVDNSIAVQFSSNDRLRLISSELVKKSTKYCVIGSGLDASSKELSETEIEKISKDLSSSMGSTIKFDYKVDKELIGGLKLQLGSFMIDTSIKNKLKIYEQKMLEN